MIIAFSQFLPHFRKSFRNVQIPSIHLHFMSVSLLVSEKTTLRSQMSTHILTKNLPGAEQKNNTYRREREDPHTVERC